VTKSFSVARRRKLAKTAVVEWSQRLVEIRERTGLTQREFAAMIGVSSKTLENWEQGRRQPTGPTCVLLAVLEREPDAVMRAVRD
jgi:putative transcriptional regulator